MQVEDLLNRQKISYTLSGKDLVTLCFNPEHDDTNAGSFRIDKITGAMNCFACGFKGSVFAHFGTKGNPLMIAREKLKRKISEKLAENVGLEIPTNAVPFAREWRGISADTYRKFEAFEHNDSDFIGRVVFPIRSFSGRIAGFNARHLTLNQHPKYLISPPNAKLPLFPKVKPVEGSIVLVEGMFDMLNLHDKGLDNAVCAFGTRKVTKDKLNLLKVQGVSRLDIMFDPDEAGTLAAAEVKELAERMEMYARVITLKNQDPGELTASEVLRLKEKLYG